MRPSAARGHLSPDDLTLLDRSWYRRHGVVLLKGRRVTRIDRQERAVWDEKGETSYDVCVLATGSVPLTPPIAGRHRAGAAKGSGHADQATLVVGDVRAARASTSAHEDRRA